MAFNKSSASASPLNFQAPATGLAPASMFTPTAPTLGGSPFPNTPAPSIGLGGSDFSTSSMKSDTSSGANPQDGKALKDENLLPSICQDVENFQKFVKESKQFQEEMIRMSSKAMEKVQDDIKSVKQQLSVSANALQCQEQAIGKLRLETTQEWRNADIAMRTRDGLQHESAPLSDYFCRLVEQFEVQLKQYRQQIEDLETHMTTQSSGSPITPQDLSMAMQKLYEAFVQQAAQLQSVHENVKNLKHQYLTHRRAVLEDATDAFESKRASNRRHQSAAAHATTGPSHFSSTPNAAAVAMAATLLPQQQQQQQPPIPGLPAFKF